MAEAHAHGKWLSVSCGPRTDGHEAQHHNILYHEISETRSKGS